MALKEHRLSKRFPPMTADEFLELKAKIATGYNKAYPIVLYEGEIIDGRHRNQACVELGVEPVTVDFAEVASGKTPSEFVPLRLTMQQARAEACEPDESSRGPAANTVRLRSRHARS